MKTFRKFTYRYTVVGLLLLSGHFAANAQITLDRCRQMAQANYPLVRQYGLIESSRDYSVANAAKAWLPQVSASAGASAFTDILKEDGQLAQMGIKMKNWMADGSLTVNQNIYDGGQTAARKRLLKSQADVDSRQVDVSMYDLHQRVEQLYFGVLVIDEQLRQNELLQKDLSLSLNTVESLMRGGMANQSDVDAVSVEQVKARQQEGSLRTSRRAWLTMLGSFIGHPLSDSVTLQKPAAMNIDGLSEVRRPELAYYDAQQRLVDSQRRELDSKLRPQLSAFGMGLLHTKVVDAVHTANLFGGLTLSWNIGALYTRKNDLRKLEVRRHEIETQRATFLFNNQLQNENAQGRIDNLRSQIAQDDEIIRLRERIRSKSEKKVELGTETVNEMLRDINAVSEARQQKALHEIQLLQEVYSKALVNNWTTNSEQK